MKLRQTILCAVDFSDASRGALRYAVGIAEHIGARLIVLTVEDPLFTEGVQLGRGTAWNQEDTRHELATFATHTLGGNPLARVDVDFEVAVGKPAKEILQVAREKACSLIVMSTHGVTGKRTLFFGSTTERVLRETTIPVLATPPGDDGAVRAEQIKSTIGRILVPVDLTAASLHHVQVARAISEALDIPFIVTHVIEPVRSPLAARLHLPSVERERRTQAEAALAELLGAVSSQSHPEALMGFGDPAEEIAKIARDRRVGLIVVALHGSPVLGPRMGSVTYRVLCLAPSLVLAVPPARTVAPLRISGETKMHGQA